MKKPNVILFFTDQQRWDTSSLFGNPLNLTPNYDRLAQEGTHMANCTTCQPVCGPARSCLQTGQYATETGCVTNGIKLSENATTLADVFNKADYETGYIGKWHLASHGIKGAVPKNERGGYKYWLAANVLEHESDSYDCILYNNNNEKIKLPGYRSDAMTDAAIRYIDQQKENPFLLCLSYLEPHHQNSIDDYPAPVGFREPYNNRWTPPDLAALGGSSQRQLPGYYGMVKRLDEALGRIYDSLKSLNILDNTILAFISDHGCHFKTRNAEYKRSCHESSIRVPCMFSGPGFESGGRRKELFSIVDLMPTLIDAAGLEIPNSVQGSSIMPNLNHACKDWRKEALIQISESHVGRSIRTHKWKYAVKAPNSKAEDGCSKEYEESFLYDLEADPYELENLIGIESLSEITDKLKARLIQAMIRAGEEAPNIVSANKRPSKQYEMSPELGEL